ncbi:MAG: succinylglutamate desuccinylase/aspartoacylase family protein [Halolamina sp.]|uniref:succinylglutamate desuccinylase/aspartoacylase family protein n=1 Tax=Halolamina sp. TaxID=1940283 RepID=UPI002FC32B14
MTTEAFTYNGGRIDPGERQRLRFTISQTYLGDPIRIPVTVINGEEPGPTAFLSAAVHGDELNGIEVVRRVANDWELADLAGTLVCLPIINVPAFLAQQRYLPASERDLNRSFPGAPDSTAAKRMADQIFRNFIEPCEFGLDFHTSTRGRTNTLHARADMANDDVSRLAHAFATNVIIDTAGPTGTLRREATAAGTPTVTIEMGEAHRFQGEYIDRALTGVESVLAEYGMLPQSAVTWPGWRTVVTGEQERTWLRADAGGIADMHADIGSLVQAGEPVATISNPFASDRSVVEAPFPGLLVGALENPIVYPGNPLCHLAQLDEGTRRVVAMRQGLDVDADDDC